MSDEVLAHIQASAPRRIFGVGALAALGGMLLYLAMAQPPAHPGWLVFLVGTGLTTLFLADKMRRATLSALELTATEFRSSDGTRIATIDQIEALDRGTFAFKPSNGFTLRLSVAAPRRWQPGLWWGLGRRVGVGGVTSAAQTKAVAEILSAMLAERKMNDR